MASTSKSLNYCHVRSISLPSRSHPSIFKLEEELNKLKILEPTSPEAISNGLVGLVESYKYVDEILNLPTTIQVLSNHQSGKWVDELLEGSVRLLDICDVTRDITSQFKENVRDLQSTIRRKRGDMSIETSVTKFTSMGKKMKKDGKRLVSSLKQMDKAIEASILDIMVIRVIKEINAMCSSIFQSVLTFLLTSLPKSRPNRWALSRLIHKGSSQYEEIESMENKLRNLEPYFEGIEIGLEDMSRSLIRSRTSMLNIVSC